METFCFVSWPPFLCVIFQCLSTIAIQKHAATNLSHTRITLTENGHRACSFSKFLHSQVPAFVGKHFNFVFYRVGHVSSKESSKRLTRHSIRSPSASIDALEILLWHLLDRVCVDVFHWALLCFYWRVVH